MSCLKSLFTSLGASAWELNISFSIHLEVKEILPGNINRVTPPLCTPLALLQLARTPERSIHTHLKPWCFNFQPGDTFRPLGLKASRDYDFSPMWLYKLSYFKSCFMKVWLPISLKCAKLNSSSWNTDSSLQTLKNKKITKKNIRGFKLSLSFKT